MRLHRWTGSALRVLPFSSQGPRQRFFHALGTAGFHRIAYTEWGDPGNPRVVVCVHGLARNSRDFDFLAAELAADHRVVCMDVAGRGESDWLSSKSEYSFSTYLNDAAAMVARVTHHEQSVDWIGTSMGGLIGLFLAVKRNSPIRRLVLNDVGPFIPWGALLRLKGHISRGKRFSSLEEAEIHVRSVCAAFGALTDEQWRHLAGHSVRPAHDGAGYELRFDPAVGEGFHGHIDPEFPIGPEVLRGVDLWNTWSKLSCPTLVLRGAESEVLLPKTLKEMRERKPDLQVAEFPGVGHAPALMSEEQIAAVRDFLERPGSYYTATMNK
jgi:pimeloyl-ACP methyl ester carboxylesterase